MQITIKAKEQNKFVVQPMPPIELITAKSLESWIGKPCVLEFDDGRKKLYAYGNAQMRGAWEENKIVMDMESFTQYWKYKMLEYGLDLFTRQENAEERRAIMETENTPPEEIEHVLASQPDLYERG